MSSNNHESTQRVNECRVLLLDSKALTQKVQPPLTHNDPPETDDDDCEEKMGYIDEARENHVKKKVEEALRSKMKKKALKECDQYTAKFAECSRGRTLSVVWTCRAQAKELNQCLHQYTNDSVLEEMKKQYTLEEDNKTTIRG